MKPLELVQKVVALTRRSGDLEGAGRGRRAELARSATVGVIRVSTAVARQMQRVPLPKARPAEQVALSHAATSLRALAGATGALDALDAHDNESRDPVERALAELIVETLALVDGMLAGHSEIAGAAAAPALPERRASDSEPPKKISF